MAVNGIFNLEVGIVKELIGIWAFDEGFLFRMGSLVGRRTSSKSLVASSRLLELSLVWEVIAPWGRIKGILEGGMSLVLFSFKRIIPKTNQRIKEIWVLLARIENWTLLTVKLS